MKPVLKAGDRYGRLVIKSLTHLISVSGKRYTAAVCQCDCGNVTTAHRRAIRHGVTRSCGCLRDETRANHGEKIRRHGMEGSKEYAAWSGMKQRCRPDNHRANKWYSGIGVCARWRDSFEAFYEDMGPAPSKNHSLDRIDGSGDYEPSNCRWATITQQQRNKSSNRIVTHDGITAPLSAHCERLGLRYNTVYERIRARGWSASDALSIPVGRQ